ncbi:helix-turn-helix transcriptional regulator [Amycolatopsis sp. H20-H5]|uniref:helix-turn-helix transcriptional regulator n=1 Tax=Amycolatopsis sp. H20-H5 TaxID=3046309 RepID=UPI003FA38A20
MTSSDHSQNRLAYETRRLRTVAKLSQPQLSKQVGYTRQYVSLAENPGKNLPSRELIDALDTALNAGGRLRELREQAKIEQRAGRHTAATPYVTTPDGKAPAGRPAPEHGSSSDGSLLGTRRCLTVPLHGVLPSAQTGGRILVLYSTRRRVCCAWASAGVNGCNRRRAYGGGVVQPGQGEICLGPRRFGGTRGR